MLLYAVARQGSEGREFYRPLAYGRLIGWTDDLHEAWCIERIEWAEMVRWEIGRQGIHHTFVHVFREEW